MSYSLDAKIPLSGVCTPYTRDRDFRKFEFFEVGDPFLP